MNILISRNAANDFGGAEMTAVLQAKILKKLGHKPVIYSNNGQVLQGAKNNNIAAEFSRWFEGGWAETYAKDLKNKMVPLSNELISIIKKYEIDIINPHSRDDQICFSLLKNKHNKPVVWKDAGDLVHVLKVATLINSEIKEMLLEAMEQADYIYTLNKDQRLEILSYTRKGFDKKKLVVIPSGILFKDYQRTLYPEKKSNKLIIGVISRLTIHKGIQYLLIAMRNLIYEFPNLDLELWIVGDGDYASYLKAMADGLRIRRFTKFFGNQNNVSKYLNRMDIFVSPTEFEGWGRSVAEALYFGKPVVASNVSGVRDQIVSGLNGLLFSMGDTEELTIKLETMIRNNELRSKLARNARDISEKSGDFNRVVEHKILPLYKKALLGHVG